jgi:DNA-binding NarL/FixJ family response regulator
MASSRTSVLVVEDHALVQAGLKVILEATADLAVVGICGSAREALSNLQSRKCDVLLCDISLPDASGMELLSQVRSQFPHVHVLVHSSHSESQFGLNALKSGAAGYVSKSASAEELLRAIRTVARGHRYVSPALAGLLVDGLDGPTQAVHTLLSQREFNVLRRLATGESVTQIAQALQLSVKTVSTYRSRILQKMGLENNADLTRYCLRHELT